MKNQGRFSDQEIVEILFSDESDGEIAKWAGISRSGVAQIRTGLTYAHVRPDIPRRTNKTCLKCLHWHNRACSLDFPDPKEEGPRFASLCSSYTLQSD